MLPLWGVIWSHTVAGSIKFISLHIRQSGSVFNWRRRILRQFAVLYHFTHGRLFWFDMIILKREIYIPVPENIYRMIPLAFSIFLRTNKHLKEFLVLFCISLSNCKTIIPSRRFSWVIRKKYQSAARVARKEIIAA